MKIPKLKKPNKAMPSLPLNGFTIKNGFLKKHMFSLIVIAVLLIGTGTAYGTLSSRDADRGEDPVYGVNEDRYQVLVSGNGYVLSKDQEKNYKLQKKQNEANAARAAASTPRILRTSNGLRIFRSSNNSYRSHVFRVSRNPRISSNISDQISMESSWKAGDTLKFKVSAYAYPYMSKNAISSSGIKVKVTGGGTAKVYNKQSNAVYYEVKLAEGKNKITITAKDKKTKKASVLGPYTVTAGENKSGSKKDSSGSGNSGGKEPGGTTPGSDTVKKDFTITAGTEGTAESVTLSVKGLDVDDKTTISDVLSKAGIEIEDGEVIYVPGDFSKEYSDSDLESMYREEKGIQEDEELTSDQLEELSTIKEDLKEGAGKDRPFPSTSWECSQDLNQKVKELKEEIELTLTLHE